MGLHERSVCGLVGGRVAGFDVGFIDATFEYDVDRGVYC